MISQSTRKMNFADAARVHLKRKLNPIRESRRQKEIRRMLIRIPAFHHCDGYCGHRKSVTDGSGLSDVTTVT